MGARVRVEKVKRRNDAGKLVVAGYRLRARGADGKRFTPEDTGVFEKESDAKAIASQIEKRLIDSLAGRKDPNANTADAFERFLSEAAAGLANHKGKRCGDPTIKSYRYNCREFVAAIPLLRNIDGEAVLDWLVGLEELGVAKWTIHNKKKDVRTFLNWLHRRKVIVLDPKELYVVQQPLAAPRYFTDEETDALEKAAVRTEPELQMTLALRLGYKAGMRRSEVLRMDRSDLRWYPDGRVELLAWADETKNGQYRMIPLAPAIVECLGTRGEGLYYPWDIGKFDYRWARLKAEAGIKERETYMAARYGWAKAMRGSAETEQARYHDLRHTFCRRMIEADNELEVLARITGHKSLDVLRKVYGHFRSKVLHDAVARAEAAPRFVDLKVIDPAPLSPIQVDHGSSKKS